MKKYKFIIFSLLIILTFNSCGAETGGNSVSGSALSVISKSASDPEYPNLPEGYVPTSMAPPPGMSAIEGKMLWPVEKTDVFWYDGDYFETKYGFINEKGETATNPDFTDFSYSIDLNGKYEYLFAQQSKTISVYTMDGKKVMEAEGRDASIIRDLDYLVTYTVSDNYKKVEIGSNNKMAVYDMKTKNRVLAKEYQFIYFLSKNIVLLLDNGKPYLCDLRKGEDKKTELDGYPFIRELSYHSSDDFLIPAAKREPETEGSYYNDHSKSNGYIDSSGKWILEPVYEYAGKFTDKYAIVQKNGNYFFINKQGAEFRNEGYKHISENKNGYSAYSEEWGQGEETTLDHELNDQNNGWINGIYYYKDKPYPSVPKKYNANDIDLSVVADDSILFSNNTNSYWLNLETGEGKEFEKKYDSFDKRPYAIIFSYNEGKSLDVYDLSGNIMTDTAFHKFKHLRYSFDIGGYLWVTTANYQGYVNIKGEWLYKESRHQMFID